MIRTYVIIDQAFLRTGSRREVRRSSVADSTVWWAVVRWVSLFVLVSPILYLGLYQNQAWGAPTLEVGANQTYQYTESFSSDKAMADSLMHAVLWPYGSYSPLQPFLAYSDDSGSRRLCFYDYLGEPAWLVYRFQLPLNGTTVPLEGSLQVDALFPGYTTVDSSGPRGGLWLSTSEDGQNWSTPRSLSNGRNAAALSAQRGICYVRFQGYNVAIDNLVISLYTPTAAYRVPGDFPTIQRAIDAARNGDIIEILPGTYTGSGNNNIDFRGKSITVRSTAGPDDTVILCQGAGPSRGFYFHSGESGNAVLQGVTIRQGMVPGSASLADTAQWGRSANHPIGGGIYCEFSSPTLVDCVVVGCQAEIGGGIGCMGGRPTLVGCVITDCTAGGQGPAESGGLGGGLALIRGAQATLADSLITANSGYYNSQGGGIFIYDSSAVIEDCVISLNSAPGVLDGGGLYVMAPRSPVMVMHSIFTANEADAGSALYGESLSTAAGDPLSITYCTMTGNSLINPAGQGATVQIPGDFARITNSIIWNNRGTSILMSGAAPFYSTTYSNIQGGYPGMGNMNTDPLFYSENRQDYHLRSVNGRFNPATDQWETDAYQSPCIDTANPLDDTSAEPWPNGECCNMGAYGQTPEASKALEGTIYYVDNSIGFDNNSGTNRQNAFRTIKRAVEVADTGDIVLVWPGVYIEHQGIDFNGKGITVQGAEGAAVVMTPGDIVFSFYHGEGSRSSVRNLVITGSEAAIYCEGASPTIEHVTITGNSFGIQALAGSRPHIENCIFWGNQQGDLFQCQADYSCIQNANQAVGTGNISQDPLFADAENGDYHLMSVWGRYESDSGRWVVDDRTSPCIDGGAPNDTLGSEPWPNGGRNNLGAYGGTGQASLSPWTAVGDQNHDGAVNGLDLAVFSEDWVDRLSWGSTQTLMSVNVSSVSTISRWLSIAVKMDNSE